MDLSLTTFSILLLTLISLESRFSVRGTVTQSPSVAYIGDSVTVSCVLNVPSPGDEFISRTTRFIIRNTSNPILESTVNSNGIISGIDLSRFTAYAPVENITRVIGSITLLSYQPSDEGLLMGCRNDIIENEGTSQTPFFETLRLNQASTVTQSPSAACIGDSITVNCVLNVPSPGDEFISRVTSFIIRNTSNPILESTVNGNSTISGIDLSRFTAYAPVENITRVTGSITLLSYQTYDEGLLMGCRNDIIENEGTSQTPFFETLILNQAIPDDNFRIRLNVSENSLIEPGLTPFISSVPLLFNFTLYNNTDEIETLSNIAYSDLNSQSFLTEFSCDVCYRMTASVLTCSDEVREVTSKHFILPSVRNGDGSFQNVSTLSSHRIAWIYEFNSPRCNGSDLEEYYFISKNYFKFSLYRNETQESVPITEFDLNFPLNFTFTIPPSFDVLNETILLRILFNGYNFTKEDIVLFPRQSLPIVIPPYILPSTTIILVVVFLLILISLVIASLSIIVFLILYMKRKRSFTILKT